MSKPKVDSSAITEAKAYISKAKKKLQTSIFQWAPRYSEGAELYQKAAELYARNRLRPEACDAWRKAVKLYKNANGYIEAAQCLRKFATFLTTNYDSELASPNSGEVSPTLQEVVSVLDESSLLFRAERAALAIDVLHSLVDVVEGVLRKDPVLKNSLIEPVSLRHPSTPLYDLYVSATVLLLSVYHLLCDRVELHPYRVPTLCRSAVVIHLKWGNVEEAIALEKHLVGGVHPLVSQIVQRHASELVLANVVSSLQDVQKNGIEKTQLVASVSSPPKITSSSASSVYPANQSESSSLIGGPSTSFDDRLNVFKRLQQPSNAAKTGLEIIILILKKDYPTTTGANVAYSALSSVYGFQDSPERSFTALLLSALEEKNMERLEEVLKESTCVTFIMAPISRIAMSFITKDARRLEATKNSLAANRYNDNTTSPLKKDADVVRSKIPDVSATSSIFKNTFINRKESRVSTAAPERHVHGNVPKGVLCTPPSSVGPSFPVPSSSSSLPADSTFLEVEKQDTSISEESQERWKIQEWRSKSPLQHPESKTTDSFIASGEPSTIVGDSSPLVGMRSDGSVYSHPSSYRTASYDPRYLGVSEGGTVTPPPPPETNANSSLCSAKNFNDPLSLPRTPNVVVGDEREEKRIDHRTIEETENDFTSTGLDRTKEEHAKASPESLSLPVRECSPRSAKRSSILTASFNASEGEEGKPSELDSTKTLDDLIL